MKTKTRTNTLGFTLVELLVVIAIIAGLAALSAPIVMRQIGKARGITALNNAKDIYTGVRDHAFKNQGKAVIGVNSVDAFQILLTGGTIRDEKPFYVKGVPPAIARAGNEDRTLDGTVGSKENVFSLGVASAAIPVNITTDSPNTPLIVSPMQSTTAGSMINIIFDNWYGKQVVVITSDGSGNLYPLDDTGAVTNPETGAPYTANTATQANNPWSGKIMVKTPTEALADTTLILPY